MLWAVIVKRSPDQDKHITKDELRYIQESLGTSGNEQVVHPWKEIFRSKAVYAISASHFAENWGFYTLLTQLPTFLKGDLNSANCEPFLIYLSKFLYCNHSRYIGLST